MLPFIPQPNPALTCVKVESEAMSCINNSVPLVGTKLTCNTWLASRSFARKAGIEPTLTVLETALLPLEDFRKAPGLEARAVYS